MLKKTLITTAAIALLSVLTQITWTNGQGRQPILSQCEIPVKMLIDKYAEIKWVDRLIELHEKGDYMGKNEYWEGSAILSLKNNFPIKVDARIEPYNPNIADGWDCLLDGDQKGFNNDARSDVALDPFPNGIDIRLWACCWGVNHAKRPSSQTKQRVATVYITVTE